MNRQQCKEQRAKAAEKLKECEAWEALHKAWDEVKLIWGSDVEPNWDGSIELYKIKPEPKYREFRVGDVLPLGKWVKCLHDNSTVEIMRACVFAGSLSLNESTPQSFKENWVFSDTGEPVGVRVEE